jgi:hypothetical protein
MDVLTDQLLEARSAHLRRDWGTSYAAFVRVDGMSSMTLDDLDAYAAAAWRLGHAGEAVRLAERVYDRLTRADPAAAARKAAELGLEWRTRGHEAVALSWVDKARVLLIGAPKGGVHGYVAYLDAVTAFSAADLAAFVRSAEILRDTAVETGDVALTVLGRVLMGVSALLDTRTTEGYRLLDDALTPVVDERVPIEWAGDAYRIVLSSGPRLADDGHVAVWTRAMERWCELTGVAQELIIGPRR